ncbi:S1 family peptidase [Streptomyces sp. NBC_01210]|nr:S1 family peptidase [Streptomyces sp. NBC_01210]
MVTAPVAVAEAGSSSRPTMAQLALVSDAVLDTDVTGIAWYTDTVSGRVVVTADDSVSAAEIEAIKKAAGHHADSLQIKRMPGTLSKLMAGGEGIHSSGGRCSLGFNLLSHTTGNYYALTAGHCTNLGSTWYGDSALTSTLGSTAASSFPDNDYGAVRLTSAAAADGRVYLYDGTYRDITGAGDAYVGQSVQRSGSTTGLHSGVVTGLNVTVNYQEGTVYGLIQTTVCAERGDSGGAMFSGSTALGVTSGGSGDCSQGGTSFYQPVTEALSAYGLDIV